MNSRIFLTAAVVGLACTPAFAAPPAAATAKPAAPAGPWAKVPMLPTACYTSQDDWYAHNEASLDAVQQDHYKQNDINTAIQQKANKALSENPMAMAQAMQQAMMSDPENAQKYMERMMQQGQQAQTDVQQESAQEQQLEAESKEVLKQYEAALTKAMGPADARWTALKKKMGIAMDSPGPGELGVPDWAWDEWGVILHERDQAYAANCAKWFSTTGPIHVYMKKYKDYLVAERTPSHKRLVDDPALDQFKMLNVSAAGYRTTSDYEAAEMYIRKAYTVFSPRKERPYCTATGCE